MKILTVENLEEFFRTHQLSCFSAKETGYQICVQIPIAEKLIPVQFDEDKEDDGQILFAWTKLFHTGKNQNKSVISEEAGTAAMKKLAYKPVLANFIETDNGELDFSSHDFEEDEDGNVIYYEKPVGCFVDEDFKVDEEETDGKKFFYAKIAIPKEYTPAASVLTRKGGTKISMEAIVNEITYNKDEAAIEFLDFEIKGATLLGDHIAEGMKGAKVSLEDFSLENNSMFEKVEDATETFKTSLEGCGDKKGGTGKMNKDIEKKTEEAVEEALEEKDEAFADENGEDDPDSPDNGDPKDDEEDSEEDPEEDPENSDDPKKEDPEEPEKPKSGNEGETKKKKKDMSKEENFENSLPEKINKICKAMSAKFGYDFDIVDLFDNRAIVSTFGSEKLYSVSVTEVNDEFELSDELVPVYKKYLTKEELTSENAVLEELESLREEVATYRLAEANAAKDKILSDPAYQPYIEEAEFVELIAARDELTPEEFESKAESAFAKCVKRIGHIKRKHKKESQFNFSNPNIEDDSTKNKYGNLFSKKK